MLSFTSWIEEAKQRLKGWDSLLRPCTRLQVWHRYYPFVDAGGRLGRHFSNETWDEGAEDEQCEIFATCDIVLGRERFPALHSSTHLSRISHAGISNRSS